MKKFIVSILAVFLFQACDQKPSNDYIVLTGTITDSPSPEFRLVKRNSGTPQLLITLDENGSFSDTLRTGTGLYILYDPRNRADLYLTQGGTYHLEVDGKNFKPSAKVTGTDPGASNYLITKYARLAKVRGDYAEFNKLNEVDYKAKSKLIKNNLINYLDSFPNIPKEFAKSEREELQYSHLLNLMKYENLHQRFTEKSTFNVSSDFLSELKDVDYTDEAAYKMPGSYKDLVALHYQAEAAALAANEQVDQYLAKLKVFSNIPNDHIKNSLLVSAANFDIGYTDDIDTYFQEFLAASTSTQNNETIQAKYDALKKLSKGAPSPVFTDYVNHAGGTNSLTDYKGKYVYIDVWATWCGPCLAEVPALKEVEKQYHGKNIEFLSISIDTEPAREAWRKMVTDKELGGVQLLADQAWQSAFISAYEINSIPRFIIIDPDGNIVNSNAPRPSDKKLLNIFNELGI